MARPNKVGIPYFGMDTDFFEDTKIKILLSKYGSDGIAAYLKIISAAYKEHGYYFPADEDSLLIMGGELGLDHERLQEVIEFMCAKGLFDAGLKERSNILTCVRMQKQYLAGTERRSEVHLDSGYLLIDPLKVTGKSHKAKIYVDGNCITEDEFLYDSRDEKESGNSQSDSKVKANSKVKNLKVKEVDASLFDDHLEEVKSLYVKHTRIVDPNVSTHIEPVLRFYAENPFPEYLSGDDVTACIARVFARLDKSKGVRVDLLCKNIQWEMSRLWEERLDKKKQSARREAELERRRRREAEQKEKAAFWTKKGKEYVNFFEQNLDSFKRSEIDEVNEYLKEGNWIGVGSVLEPKMDEKRTKV